MSALIAQPMLDSPIRWVGGKNKLRAQVIDYLPADAECYGEVFAGAAWVLFGKVPHPVEVINDRNSDLVNLYRVMKWRNAELLEAVHQHLYSREMFYELRNNKQPIKCELERATRMYLLIQMAFGAELENPSFGYRKVKRDLFLPRSLETFGPAKERLRSVFIENCDFAQLIARYDQPQTVFYCDPPYLGQRGYSEEFTYKDHVRLSRSLHRIQGRFLLTINDCPGTRMLYRDMHFIEATEPRGIAREAEGRVAAPILFIANYKFGPIERAYHNPSLFE